MTDDDHSALRKSDDGDLEPSVTFESDDGDVLHGVEAVEAFAEHLAEQERRRERLPAAMRDQLAAAYECSNEKIDEDPVCRAEREASGVAFRAWRAALDAGASVADARERAQEACGRDELVFDYSERADELRREAFVDHGFVLRRRSAVIRAGSRRCGHAGRDARPATNARRRGSRRTSRPTRAGPDEPSEGESEPPPRLCRLPGCGEPAKRKYCSKQHADADRQRRKRTRDRADSHGAEPIGPGKYRIASTVEYEQLLRRVLEGCRCNGHHIAERDELGVHCCKCGHARREAADPPVAA